MKNLIRSYNQCQSVGQGANSCMRPCLYTSERVHGCIATPLDRVIFKKRSIIELNVNYE